MAWFESLSGDQRFALVASGLAALLGFVFSTFGVLLSFWMTRRSETIRSEVSTKAAQKRGAYLGLSKMIKNINKMYSVESSIDGQFKETNEDGYLIVEPALAIRPLISYGFDIEILSSEEMEFLFHIGSGSLVTDIQIVESRMRTDMVALQKFNADREALEKHVLENGSSFAPDDGPNLSVQITGDAARLAEILVGKLNRQISDMIEVFPADRAKATEIARQYRDHAQVYFGGKFPKLADVKP